MQNVDGTEFVTETDRSDSQRIAPVFEEQRKVAIRRSNGSGTKRLSLCGSCYLNALERLSRRVKDSAIERGARRFSFERRKRGEQQKSTDVMG